MKPDDQFHVGIVVPDLDAELDRLTALFGYEWTDEISVTIPVRSGSGEQDVPLRFRYSRQAPYLEIIEQRPGTVWMPVAGSALHHLGRWSCDVMADGTALAAAGYELEAEGVDGSGTPLWAYYAHPTAPRIELVSDVMRPTMVQLYGWTQA